MAALASRDIDPRPLVTASGTLSDLPRFLDAQRRGLGIRYAVNGRLEGVGSSLTPDET